MTAEEIKKAIEQERIALELELENALNAQLQANARVKLARAELAAAPRLHVPKKYPGRRKTATVLDSAGHPPAVAVKTVGSSADEVAQAAYRGEALNAKLDALIEGKRPAHAPGHE